MAVLFGLFDSDNYNWRSMTSPGITGLFNNHCLLSGQNNLMKCYPGDNTYDGVQTEVSLVNLENQFHSLKTTVETNGESLHRRNLSREKVEVPASAFEYFALGDNRWVRSGSRLNSATAIYSTGEIAWNDWGSLQYVVDPALFPILPAPWTEPV